MPTKWKANARKTYSPKQKFFLYKKLYINRTTCVVAPHARQVGRKNRMKINSKKAKAMSLVSPESREEQQRTTTTLRMAFFWTRAKCKYTKILFSDPILECLPVHATWVWAPSEKLNNSIDCALVKIPEMEIYYNKSCGGAYATRDLLEISCFEI